MARTSLKGFGHQLQKQWRHNHSTVFLSFMCHKDVSDFMANSWQINDMSEGSEIPALSKILLKIEFEWWQTLKSDDSFLT